VKSKYLLAFFLIGALAFVEVAVLRTVNIRISPGKSTVAAAPAPTTTGPPKPYDITPLVRPGKKYLGVTVEGGADLAKVDSFAYQIGKKPNLVAIFESFKDGFAASEVRKVYGYGGLAIIRWEPTNVPMQDIVAGKQDAYITTFAKAVRALNLPISLTFGHEMNGFWYTWGAPKTSGADFVAAWRHTHDLFVAQGATNVLWTWVPNVINNLRKVKLAPFYPGDAYVDWVGMDGYYTEHGEKTFRDLFLPTLTEIRTITQRPALVVETGVEPGPARATRIADLLSSVSASPDVIGCVYFNQNATKRWSIDTDPPAQHAFAEKVAVDTFGFSVEDLK
jgi:hypothetical protein